MEDIYNSINRKLASGLRHQLRVSLEIMYNGITRKLALQKNVVCDLREGIGREAGAVQHCPTGMQVHIWVGLGRAPGMMHQTQTVCLECQSQGKHIDPKLRCKKVNS